jgi:hypothetical protein
MLRQFLGTPAGLEKVEIRLERIGDPEVIDPLTKSQFTV